MDELITLSEPESNNKSFIATLKTNTPGKDFEVSISAVPPFDQQTVQAQISLKTSSTNVPTVSITAWGNVQQAVVVSPPTVMLSPGPLANKQTMSVMIQNNGATPLKLSEPKVDNDKVQVQLNEPNPGRSFTAVLNFPEGFDLQGQKAEFTVKSDHPKHALIKIPISQMPKAVATPVVPHPTVVPLTPTPAPAAPAPPAPASASASKPAGQ
jgi:hypothetical protein